MTQANMKVDGWAQSLYEQSVTKKEKLGALRIDDLGRKFRYAHADGALVAGKMCRAADAEGDFVDKTGVAASIGDTEVTVTIVNPGAAYAEDHFAEGQLVIRDQLISYPIIASQAIAATAQVTCKIHLAEPLHVAITASMETELAESLWQDVLQDSTQECVPVGVALIAVTDNYYCWLQTGGVGIWAAAATGSPTVGTMLIPSATTGRSAIIGANQTAGGTASTFEVDRPFAALAMGTATASDAQVVKFVID